MQPTPPTQWSVRNVINALVVAALSAGILACHLYASDWPKPTAIISLAIIVFASLLRLPISTVIPPPAAVNVQQADTVNVRPPESPPDPPPQEAAPFSDDRPALRVPRSTK